MNRYLNTILALLAIAALVLIGLFGSRFVIYITSRVMILSIFAMGYNVLFGRTGLLSFGHAAFYAAGAYGLGLFSLHVHPHPLAGILVGVICAGLLSAMIGYFCVRHTEIYFAMLTLAFGMMVFSLIWNMRSVTGGDDGLVGIMRAPIALGVVSIPMIKPQYYYFLILSLLLLTTFLIYRILHSPFGLVLAGIRENEKRVVFAGVSLKNYRLGAFVISGTFAGLAGALAALLESHAEPFSAHWSHSAAPILVTLIGGLQTFIGPIVGSAVFIVLREMIERFTHNWMLWFGLILLVIIMGFRGGIVGMFASRSK
ncbi:branched-chain amino acid ABC transporter permease [Desulfatitalea tepidiphila]|uniref:branched-chain amino acid ABC transporter permease n=1 Tax=Desulfatitalea tepidiphila TaxID=1185843 RepID=UPI0006B57FC6|nr:branched-chain amino acid ABC transporter permease [Desulfatitalea tepidiphila]